MKRGVIALALMSIFLISGMSSCDKQIPSNQTAGGGDSVACWSVFKTNADYSNFLSVRLIEPMSSQPFFVKSTKLNNGYLANFGLCAYSDSWNVTFTDITWDEWNQSLHFCDQYIADRRNELIVQKCGSLDFDIFEECTSSPGQERTCISTIPPANVQNPKKCTYDITSEDGAKTSTCEPTLTPEILAKRAIYSHPFAEFYLCHIEPKNWNGLNASFDELNSIINNDALSTNCTQKV